MTKKKEDVAHRIRAVFGVSPKEFTAARDALAAELKKEGHGAESKEVKALKRPPSAAALMNLVAQRYPADVKAMLNAGDAVEKAQRKGQTSDLHAHGAEHRALIRSLVERAESIAGEVRISFTQALRSKVETAFRVASANDEDREAVETGTLTRELAATGFDALFSGGGISSPKPEKEPKAAVHAPAKKSEKKSEKAEQKAAKQAAAKSAREQKANERAFKAAEKELQRAKSAQAALEEKAVRLQRELAASTTNLERAQEKLDRLKNQ